MLQYGLNTGVQYVDYLHQGGTEKWLHSSNGSNAGGHGWYLLESNGNLVAWDGSSHPTGTVVATVDPSVYTNPALLYAAAAPPIPAVTLSVSSGVLTVTPSVGFLGTFRIYVTVDDGAEQFKQSFLFTVTP
jgi:hypothetical protein